MMFFILQDKQKTETAASRMIRSTRIEYNFIHILLTTEAMDTEKLSNEKNPQPPKTSDSHLSNILPTVLKLHITLMTGAVKHPRSLYETNSVAEYWTKCYSTVLALLN